MAQLLSDENLSHRLVTDLGDLFPGSVHVRDAELSRAVDNVVWDFARDSGLTIVSKDSDFNQMSFLYGAPPKVIWLRVGNCTTANATLSVCKFADELDGRSHAFGTSFVINA